jgi:hypothetical protein
MRGYHAKSYTIIFQWLADCKHVTVPLAAYSFFDNEAAGQEFRRSSMTQAHGPNVIAFDPQQASDWSKLMRKLQWIGLEEEARRLALAVSALPAEERPSISIAPLDTD